MGREILRRAAARVRRGWCQNAGALDAGGQSVDPRSETACRWCATSSIHRAAWDMEREGLWRSGEARFAAIEIASRLLQTAALGRVSCKAAALECWNDGAARTSEQVAAALSRAAELLDC